MAEAKTAKAAKKPGFFKELITFLFVVALILGIASGAIFYLSGKNLDDLLGARPVAKKEVNQPATTPAPKSPASTDQEAGTNQRSNAVAVSSEGTGATDVAMPAAYPVETPGQQSNEGGQVARTELPTEKGALKGTITWQYNDFVGTKPDVNARIYLIPTDFDKNTITDLEEGMFAYDTIAPKGSGLYAAKANGYGNYEIGNVPAGEYHILVVSKQTIRNVQEPVDDLTAYTLNPYVRDWENFEAATFLLYKHVLSKITIEENQTLDFSHDFGNTYI
ncbi:hypothetical protein [Brevibacillus porteri]|uniref:Carboxypeptidase regulatory-like domain-containing protein n=1 Tax=Brevibacillus porteri TaxID=2126350 RepID=A0ABX5FX85_9BACL|nr:hypothetical protein [Brevibacillus porteri]MED1800828.1 hypothetical protein [Brevibacillus porteri]MED2130214.1 hypothetical protein [Brevibacillus porteri]MED2742942.1 hypothetical protein [Brevibacillus porteri]MED2817178.1 hypothetical protein [Brevibacillus porteri]MED2895841.1 hypothetical protein [Brevibacillus porteri]